MSYIIVIDSCGELTPKMKESGLYISAPLTLQIEDNIVVDDDTFDQAEFLKMLAASEKCAKSACPSPDFYKEAFATECDHAYAITLSAELSGSYNSAELGRQLYLEEHPEKKIHVFNSKSASVGETLIGLKIQECEDAGMDFETVVHTVDDYIVDMNTTFVLENLETLRKNGRLSNLKAFFATALKIKPVLGSTPEGQIVQLDQARGINKALVKLVNRVVEITEDSADRVLAISHCNCPERAQMIRDAIMDKMKVKDCVILDTAGVSTMYANDGGIIVVI